MVKTNGLDLLTGGFHAQLSESTSNDSHRSESNGLGWSSIGRRSYSATTPSSEKLPPMLQNKGDSLKKESIRALSTIG